MTETSVEERRHRLVKLSTGSIYKRVRESRVLVVGAGGIGCELLKNLVLSGFGSIHIVDLDTIDLSNLNRQFLFNMQHLQKAKALVAKETASRFNPNVKLTADHSNIKDSKFDVEWFKSFNVVFNALDNLDARRHVNKMCLAANVPLIESGTTGFNGQVQVIVKSATECYDCTPKPVPKSFPVCTIRSTPSQPIHCIVWAKNYLFSELFGVAELDDSAEETVENANEVENLKREAAELKRIRETLGQEQFTRNVFDKVFHQDVQRLVEMGDMWKTRTPPTPLSFSSISLEPAPEARAISSRDRVVWSLKENVIVFADSLTRLSRRVLSLRSSKQNQILTFDKDDLDILDFVTASANIRSFVFEIERKSKFDIKQMAGNIIPAIATTNAITAGLCVLEGLKVLRNQIDEAKMVFMSMSGDRGLTTEPLRKPNPSCHACGVARLDLEIDIHRGTLGSVIEEVLRPVFHYGEALSLISQKLLYDEDYEDNVDETLASLGIVNGTFITVTDESDDGPSPRINLIVHIKHREIAAPLPSVVIPQFFEIPRKTSQLPSLDTLVLNGTDSNNRGAADQISTSSTKKRKAKDVAGAPEFTQEFNKKIRAENTIVDITEGYIELD